MKKLFISLMYLLLFFPNPLFGQKKFQSIKRDTTFKPYVNFNEKTGNYVIGYMKSVETGKIYETFFIPTTKINPQFSIQVKRKDKNYIYIYKLLNKKSARQDIMGFELEIEGQFHRINLPEPWFSLDISKDSYILFLHRGKAAPTEMVRFKADIQLGEFLTFKIYSSKLPQVISAYATGRAKKLYPIFALPPTLEVRILLDGLRKTVKENVKLMTIGPRQIPEHITPPAFLDTLQNYLTFSCDTTWITNRGICRSLQAKLDNVEKQLSKEKFKQAVNGLRAFLNEVQTQKGKHLSSEAYALLYFNGKFLKTKLEEQVGGKKGGRGNKRK